MNIYKVFSYEIATHTVLMIMMILTASLFQSGQIDDAISHYNKALKIRYYLE